MASKSKYRHEDIGTVPAGYKVRTVIHPSGHRVRIAFPPGPRRKGTGQIVSVLHPLSGANPCKNPCGEKFTRKNLDETIIDSKGRRWGVSVLSGGKDWMAEGYPVKGHGIKTRVGRPIVARGASESEAYDKLSEAIDRRNPKKKKAVTTAEEHKKKVEAMLAKMPKALRDVFDRNPAKRGELLAAESLDAAKKALADAEKAAAAADKATKKKNRKAKVKGQRSKIKGNKKGRGEKSAPSIKSKKNLDELQDAQKVYEKFQGEAGSKVTTFDEPAERRDDFAKLGGLVEIIAQPEGDPIDGKEAAKMWSQANDNDPESVQNGEIWETIATEFGVELVRLSFRKDKAWLCSDARGTQLYNIGGSQNLDPVLGKFGADATKDLCDLGWCIAVCYLAAKAHDDHQLLEHVHHLGEEGGMPPRLQYNRLQHRLFYVGGTYRIEAPGIVN